MKLIAALVLCSVMLFACTGDESFEVDNNAPLKPTMIFHVGDLGDGTITYIIDTPEGEQSVTIDVDDDNNGIDAVPDDDWIRIQWAPLLDIDLDYIEIWRGKEGEEELSELTRVDSIRANGAISYIDTSLDDIGESPVGINWNYFIRVVDQSGNSTVSDTVSYCLLDKPLLDSPANESHIAAGAQITFRWFSLLSGSASRYRLLLFDAEHHKMWQYDKTDTNPEEYVLETVFGDDAGESLLSGQYYWRVDALGDSQLIPSGAESIEIPFYYGE